jgi:hypothetical protein
VTLVGEINSLNGMSIQFGVNFVLKSRGNAQTIDGEIKWRVTSAMAVMYVLYSVHERTRKTAR